MWIKSGLPAKPRTTNRKPTGVLAMGTNKSLYNTTIATNRNSKLPANITKQLHAARGGQQGMKFRLVHFKSCNGKMLSKIKREGIRFFHKNGYAPATNKVIDKGSEAIAVKDADFKEIVGLLTYKKIDSFIWMGFVYVQAEHRRSGLFTMMFDNLNQYCMSNNLECIRWGCSVKNACALKTYMSFSKICGLNIFFKYTPNGDNTNKFSLSMAETRTTTAVYAPKLSVESCLIRQ
jgi:hypothetical protein